ncbi:MAG TPA: hypothetical protein V6C85_38030 [Allocoleopsis sp.]
MRSLNLDSIGRMRSLPLILGDRKRTQYNTLHPSRTLHLAVN